MLVSVFYLMYYQGVILAQMPSILQVTLVNSTAMRLHNELGGMYQPVDKNVYQKIDRYTGRTQYIFIRDGGGLDCWIMYIII